VQASFITLDMRDRPTGAARMVFASCRDVGSVLKSGDGNVGNSWIGQQNGGSMKHQWPLLPNILCPCNLQRCWWKAAYPNWQCSFASCPL